MDKYIFNVEIVFLPAGAKKVSVEEAEKILSDKLREKETDEALLEMANFYKQSGKPDLAFEYIEKLINRTDNLEKRAFYYLKLGQLMEDKENYEKAIYYYRQVLLRDSGSREVRYFANNNLGYCLNITGLYSEAEKYCRKAIEIYPYRYNACKNLGISLEKQENYIGAAGLYLEAIHSCASDGRALNLLRNLAKEHPEIADAIPDITEQILLCQKAVELAGCIREQRQNDKGVGNR